MSLSLISIMRDDPDFGKRISKKVQEIKVDKQNLLNVADQYGKEYEKEIVEGTLKRAKLLSEGASRGLSEEETMAQFGRFVPTVYTPILNLLYFMIRETENQDREKYRRRDAINEVLIKNNVLEHDDRDLDSSEIENLFEEFQKNLDTETRSTKARQELNKRMLEEEKLAEDATKLKDTPDMVNFLYGNITLDMFNKIKKLKALSKSPNEREAFLAYRKAIELCKQYNLDFDRIPCYVEGQENG